MKKMWIGWYSKTFLPLHYTYFFLHKLSKAGNNILFPALKTNMPLFFLRRLTIVGETVFIEY